MKLMLTKKEFDVLNETLQKALNELSKDETLELVEKEDFINYDLNNLIKNTSDNWGYVKLSKRSFKSNHKLILDIDENCIEDFMNLIYNPALFKIIKCMINIFKTFNSIIMLMENNYKKFFSKWITTNE